VYRPTDNIYSSETSKEFSKKFLIVYKNKIQILYFGLTILEKKQLTSRDVTLTYVHESQPFQDM
jgi:2',3'-cyclic-nucleotide 2'-phosphodiesterase (5'-nucleotidase family)